MIEIVTASHGKKHRLSFVSGFLGYCLPLLAVVVACCITFSCTLPVSIGRPGILVFGALFVVAPFRSEFVNTLQKVAAFYLVAVPVNELACRYFHVSVLAVDVNVSYGAMVLALCAAGCLLGRAGGVRGAEVRADIWLAWTVSLVVIIAHMLLLAAILGRFYGYGYERDLNVAGSLCLYVLLFLTLWKKLDAPRFRQATGLILTAFYVALILAKK